MVVIGISMRLIDGSFKISANLINKIKKEGGVPLPILPGFEDSLLHIFKLCDGYIIPGGVTWHETDELIIKYAIRNDLPLLGICAGMQALANIHNFNKDIPSDQTIPIGNNTHQSQKEYVHNIRVVNPFLESILKKKIIRVNSRHNFTIVKEDFFVIDAYSEDGVIEAIHLPNKKFILGMQWHPEDLNDDFSARIFKSFVDACKNK